MPLLSNIIRLIRRGFPGFPEAYQTRLGVVMAIPDPTAEEKATDRFRPRYAVDVQPLDAQGQPDGPILEALPLPASPVLQFPNIGERVRLGYDYGLAAFPYIAGLVAEGQPMPALQPGEALQPHPSGAFIKIDQAGNITIQTGGALTLDAQDFSLTASAVVEALGSLLRTVTGDAEDTVEGSRTDTVLGAHTHASGDFRRVVLGGQEAVVTGSLSELVGADREMITGQKFKVLVVPGVGSIAIGDGINDLLAIIDGLITAQLAETHATGTGPSGPPNNVADYAAEKLKLAAIKEA